MNIHTIIRFANRKDIPSIMRFIRDLAQHLKLLYTVKANQQALLDNLFGDSPKAEALIAELDSKPVGMAIFFHTYSTFLAKPGIYLEDLYVCPEFAGYGIGKEIFCFLAKVAVERNCCRIEGCVPNSNVAASDFYLKLGAKAMDEWTVFRVDDEALLTIANDCFVG